MNIMNSIIPVLIFIIIFEESIADTKYEMLDVPKTDTFVNELSSWELFVINDLVFQITMKKCPKIDRPAASSLKEYITDAIKMAPQEKIKQHADFLPNYKTMMSCFDEVDKNSRNPGKKLEFVRFIDDEPSKKFQPQIETQKAEQDSLIMKSHTEKPVEFVTSRLNYAWQDKEGEWHWKWMSKVSNIFSSILREKRQAAEDRTDKKAEKSSFNTKIGGTKQVRKLSDAKDNFIKMLYDMNQVVKSSCPTNMKPNESFSRTVILELVSWVSQDSHSLIRASDKYFGDNSLLHQIHECLESF